MSTAPRLSRSSRAIIALAALSLPAGAFAQTWDGGSAVNSNWTTPENWNTNVQPVNDGTANITFAGAVRTSPLLDLNRTVQSVVFSSSSAFTLADNGTTLTVGGTAAGNTLLVTGTGGATINSGLAVNNNSNITLTAGNLTLGKGLTLNSGVFAVVSAAIGRTFSMTTGNLIFNANSRLSMQGANGTISTLNASGASIGSSAKFDVAQGTVVATGSILLPNTTVSNTGLLRIGTASPFAALPVTIDGGGSMEATLSNVTLPATTLSNGGRLGGTGTFSLTGLLSVTGTTNTATIAAPISNTSTGSINVIGSATRAVDLQINGNISGNALSISGSSSPVVALSGTNTVAGISFTPFNGGTLLLEGPQPVASGGSITFTGTNLAVDRTTGAANLPVKLNVSTATNFMIGSSLSTILSVDLLINNNSTTTNNATFTATNPSTPNYNYASSSFRNLGSATFGTLVNFGDMTNNGTLSSTFLINGGTFTNQGYLSGNFNNQGTVVVQSSASSPVFMTGTFTFSGGTIDNSQYDQFIVNGAIVVNADLTLTSATYFGTTGSTSTITNNATLNLNNATVNPSLGGLTNNGVVTGNGLINFGAVFNNASWNVPNKLTIANCAFSNTGGNFILGPTATLQIGATSTFSNTGNLSLSNSVILTGGTLFNQPTGQITGYGTISTNFSQQGSLLPSGGTLKITNAFSNTATGIIRIASGAMLAGGNLTNNGRIQGDGTVANAVNNTAGGRIQPIGTLAFASPLTNSATGIIQLNTGNLLVLQQGFTNNTNSGLITLAGGDLDTNGSPVTNASTGQITGYGNLTTPGLRNSGAVTLTGGTSFINGPVTNDLTKNFRIQYNPAIFTGLVTNNGNLFVTQTNATFAGGYTGSVPFAGPVATDNAIVGAGNTTLSPAAYLLANGLSQSSINLQGTAASPSLLTLVTRQPEGYTPLTGRSVPQSTSVIGTLSITPGSTLDVQDNDLILTNTSESTLRSLVATWWNNGNRNGTGLASSFAAAGLSAIDQLTTLAVVPASAYPSAIFNSLTVSPGNVLVKYTYLGDTNLDGKVDTTDLTNLIKGLRSNGTLTGWANGDTNYDGLINGVDYANLLSAFRFQGAPLDAINSTPTAPTTGGQIPEPAGLALALPALATLTRRRR